jgi:ribonuclease Z
MALHTTLLGKHGADQALLVTIDTGQHISRLLLDCGEHTLSRIPFADTLPVQHVLFSHYHMDHVTGFDTYFRRHYDRSSWVNHIWGPPGTTAIMSHRFQGYVWNLIGSRQATWHTHDIHPTHVDSARHELGEAFRQAHSLPTVDRSANEPLFQGTGYEVQALQLHHGIPSIGYLIREQDRSNIHLQALQQLGLQPGPWLKQLPTAETTLTLGAQTWDAAALRQQIYLTTPGQSVAYLTDFIADTPAEQQRIAQQLQGIDHLYCECQYMAADSELALKNAHMTSLWVGQLAQLIQPRHLHLLHLSERYSPDQRQLLLQEVQSHFPPASLA